jgi:hypothetical protein
VTTRRSMLAPVLAVVLAGALGAATARSAEEKKPQVAGTWTGTWGVYEPPREMKDGEAKPAPRYPQAQMKLDCKVVSLPDGKWEATFEGECGRPYKYTVKMLGRTTGNIVLFQGTADLGKEDGGVYDWIGRASDNEFVGFYTSQRYTGHFRLARPKITAEAK